MNKSLIYARVSSKEQEKEGYSIPAQLKSLNDYAKIQNIIVVHEYIDVETAKKAGRTHFTEMISFIKENEDINNILVEKTDRLLRNIKDYAIIDELIERNNIIIHLVKENEILSRDSQSHQKLIFGIKALMAKNYVDNLSEETKKGMLEKAEQGIYPTRVPVGYLNIKDANGKAGIALDPELAPHIKRMYEIYSTGNYSLKSLREELLKQGFIYRSGKNFHKSTLENILKNEFYTGIFYWRGKKYENAVHTPIISLELYKLVQSILRRSDKPKSRKGMFPYTNLIKCGYCKGSLTAEIKKEKYIYYRCSQTDDNHGQPYLKEYEIEKQFAQCLKDIQLSEEQKTGIIEGLKELHSEKIEFHHNSIKQLNTHINKLQNRIEKMYIDKLDGKIDESFWAEQNTKMQAEKDEALIKLKAHENADKHYYENADIILELSRKAYALFKKQPSEEKKKLINLIVDKCEYKENTLHIKLKAPFDKVLLASKTGNMLPVSCIH